MPIDTYTNDATAVIVTLDCYREISLKQATSTSWKGERAPRASHISDKSNIDKVTMSELLSSKESKQSISHYLETRLDFICEKTSFDI